MSLKLISLTDKAIESYAAGREVTEIGDCNLKYDKLTPYKGGLYDSDFFGSIPNNSCNCGAVRVVGSYCKICDSEILPMDEKFFRFAMVKFPVYFTNKYKEKKLLAVFGKIVQYPSLRTSPVQNKFKYLSLCNFTWNQEINKIIPSTEYDNSEVYYSIEGLMALILEVAPDIHEEALEFLNKNIIVTPAVLRPLKYFVLATGKQLKLDSSSIIYQSLLFNKTQIVDAINATTDLTDKVMYMSLLRSYVGACVLSLTSVNNTSKMNLLRKLMSKRVEGSGRAPIIPSIDLNIDEIGLPIHLAYELYRTQFIKHISIEFNLDILTARGRYNAPDTAVRTLFREFCKNKVVVINRNPTIHKYNAMAMKVTLSDSTGISLPPLICPAFNADFIPNIGVG